jgi:hypothetical protein
MEEHSAVDRLREGPGRWRMLAPVLGYPLPRKGGELPELVGVFGVGYRGVRRRFPRRLDRLKV